MEMIELSKEEYKGKTFVARYKTGGYYHIEARESGFCVEYRPFDAEREKSFTDSFFSDWLEAPTAFGVFEGGSLLGFVEGFLEGWNNRYRISNICVLDEAHRGSGVGGMLMGRILGIARESGARMVVLETQSCNERAIAFYKKHGFQIIGFDLYAYSNTDPERGEVRVEMGLML